MNRRPISRRILAPLVGIAMVLTMTLAVVLVTGHILGKMGDAAGQTVFDAIAMGAGVAWVIDVLCLVLALGINALAENESPSGKQDSGHDQEG